MTKISQFPYYESQCESSVILHITVFHNGKKEPNKENEKNVFHTIQTLTKPSLITKPCLKHNF